MKMYKDNLTKEKLLEKFNSPFELVHYAIDNAVEMISTNRIPRVETNVQNVAYIILKEIYMGKDLVDDKKNSEKESGA